MILKDFFLYPGLGDYPDEIVNPCRYETRSICHFLERELKGLKFAADGFKRICFIGMPSPLTQCVVNSTKVLSVEIDFDEAQYLGLVKSEEVLNRFFTTLLLAGFNKCKAQFDIPLAELSAGLEKFQAGNYINQWCFKTQTIKGLGIKCALNCEMTTAQFRLTLLITKGKEVLFEQQILTTKPDEIVFAHKFKRVALMDDKLVVFDKFDNPLFELAVAELGL